MNIRSVKFRRLAKKFFQKGLMLNTPQNDKQALAYYLQAVNLLTSGGDLLASDYSALHRYYFHAALAHAALGELEHAIYCYQMATDAVIKSDDNSYEKQQKKAEYLIAAAIQYKKLNILDKAIAFYQAASDLYIYEMNHDYDDEVATIVACQRQIGDIYVQQKNWLKAAEAYKKAQHYSQMIRCKSDDNYRDLARAYDGEAGSCYEFNEYDRAIKLYEQAIVTMTNIENIQEYDFSCLATYHNNLASACAGRGQVDDQQKVLTHYALAVETLINIPEALRTAKYEIFLKGIADGCAKLLRQMTAEQTQAVVIAEQKKSSFTVLIGNSATLFASKQNQDAPALPSLQQAYLARKK